MRILLGFLPFLVLAGLLLSIIGFTQKGKQNTILCKTEDKYFIKPFTYAVVAWGGYIVFLSEILSSFKAISELAILLIWAIPLIILIIIETQQGWMRLGWSLISSNLRVARFSWSEKFVLCSLILWSIILLVIALISPPNTNDSLGYHMPRVAHWAQNLSLEHYPTAYEFQLYNAIWAELVILQVYILASSDQLANLVQWFSMVGCVYLSISIAGLLGAKRAGQLLAGVLVMTIPMGILQATSTQNDYVTAFWLTILLYFTVKSKFTPITTTEAPFLGGAIGIGMLTKGTYYPFALPLLLWLFVPLLWRVGFRKTILFSLLVALVALSLNVPYWQRNFRTYHSLIGPAWWVEEKSQGNYSPGAVIANTARQVSINLGTPFMSFNTTMSDAVIRLCEQLKQANCVALGESEQYRYRIPRLSNHEDSTGNLIHTFTIIAAICLGLLFSKRFGRIMLGYTVSLILAYLVFSAVIRWELFGSRYQLPFFVLSGALSGIILSSLLSRKGILIMELLLLTASLPWLFFNRTRPFIGLPLRITAVGSIFLTNRTDLLLANQEWIREPIIKLTNSFQSINCQKVGLWIDSRDPEYIFWSLLNAQTRGIRIESLFYEPHLEIYADKNFTPCAIICSICGGKANLDGLSLAYREHGIDLYLSTDYKSP